MESNCTSCSSNLYERIEENDIYHCEEICGDGKRIPEAGVTGRCDDGNNISGDGCDDRCYVEEDFECTGGNETTIDYCNNTQPLKAEIKKIKYAVGINSINASITFNKDVISLNSSNITSWISL